MLVFGALANSLNLLAIALILSKLLIEVTFFKHANSKAFQELNRSAKVILKEFSYIFWLRICLGLMAIGFLLLQQPMAALAFLFASEVCERIIFFGALSPDKMPAS